MQVIIEINGRQALPVRAIPLLTDWHGLSPKGLAQILAGDCDHWPSFDGLTAHRLHTDGRTEAITPRWWASWVVGKLKATSDSIKAKQTSHATGRQQWRGESLAQLPAGVFLWRDEFEAAQAGEYGPLGRRARVNPRGFDPGFHKLNFNPHPDPEIATPGLVLEGFEKLTPAPIEPVDAERGMCVMRGDSANVTNESDRQAESFGFHSVFLDLEHWAALHAVSAREAAMLLCLYNPRKTSFEEAKTIMFPDLPDGHLERLDRRLSDYAAQNPRSCRSLWAWYSAAREMKIKLDPEAVSFMEHVARHMESDSTPAAAPVVAASASNAPACDFSMLATREQLIEAFGRFTGMEASWFKNIKDTPALLSARKVAGQGGRGHIAEPLFCPFEVMQWLTSHKRRKNKDRKLSAEKAWELLEKNFPKVHSARSVADPRTGD